MFTAPVCYPIEMVPEKFRWLLLINPLTVPVESIRSMLFGGNIIEWYGLIAYALISVSVSGIGYYVFAKMRRGFADAI
jgi:lipopolysaccharide transport system permease protein